MAGDDSGLAAPGNDDALLGEVASLIEGARQRAAVAVNSELVMLYWSIGKRVREEVLCGDRAAYGQQVVRRLAERLTERYGRGWSKTRLLRMVQFAIEYSDGSIVATLSRQLSWSHFSELLAISDQQKRDFYTAFAAHERWSVRTFTAEKPESGR